MRIKTPSSAVLIWFVASVVAALSCSLYFPAAHYDGEYLPVGNDSFYHARRILDTVNDPGAFYQFDPKIHAPEGSLLVWPWGYDYLLAQIVRLGLAVGLSQDPMAILIWIPVVAVFASMGFLVRIGRQLSLSPWPLTLAALCMALAPTTQFLHGTGQIDHHYAEMIFVLAGLAGGLAWLHQPDSRVHAGMLALVLGIAPAIHNGLFILQIPFLAAVLIRWCLGTPLPRKPAITFAGVLIVSTTAVLLPSLAFRTGRFEFYTLSWFHFYIALCTALVVVYVALTIRARRTAIAIVILAVLLILPIARQIQMAHSFVVGSFKWLEAIAEMKSPLGEVFANPIIVTQIYTFLIWVAPCTFVICAAQCWRERGSPRLLFWISSTMGLILLAAQVRMHYFGDFALYLPWLVLAQDYVNSRQQTAKTVFLSASLVLVLLYASVLRHQLAAPISPANDRAFKDTRPMFSALQKACAADPGIVLADNNAGHYIRYYTDCSVIVNNFLLTPQHFAKMDEAERLFSMSATDLVDAAPYVKYVLVRPLDIRRAEGSGQGYKYWFFFPGVPQLATDLLLRPSPDLSTRYELLYEIRFPEADNVPYARLYKIKRSGDNVAE